MNNNAFASAGFVMLMAGALSACTTTGAKNSTQSASSTTMSVGEITLASEDGRTLGSLPDASLPEKSCGMVLWTLENSKPAAVFRFVSGESGEMNIAGQPVALSRTEIDGAGGFGVYERQVFANDDGLAVEVTARFGLSFSGGAYLEQGLIKLSDKDGWSIVTPTAGIAGCRD